MAGSISTRRGDGGTGQLLWGDRISKASARMEALGTIDELGSWLGVCRAGAVQDPVAERLEAIQRTLFVLGGELGTAQERLDLLPRRLGYRDLADLDGQVEELESLPGLLHGWALPGASRVGAELDVARTICRRAERRLVALLDLGEPANEHVLPYLNRLSDLLWLYARWYEQRHAICGGL